ncbi:gasdermin-A-like isoform X1 [Monodelphis domestica]|uniref:gasdermin-A-like isoform X1 n=1 Tax=Monodelphis domestica TaxID=13616 RepID=UPI0024E24796|nr:gasdermin-A-like isoform X1 [Monodelphis domestica]
MASVFQDTTQALVRQLDPSGELIPVTSIIDVSCFRPFCLVKRTRTSFWGVRYVKTDFSLRDILEDGPELPEPSKDPVIKIGENTENTMATGVTAADFQIPVMITFSAGGSDYNYLEIQKLSIVQELESLRKRKLKVPEPNFLKKLREHNENLYMVTEAVETLKDAKLEKRRKADAGIYVPLLTALGFKVGILTLLVLHAAQPPNPLHWETQGYHHTKIHDIAQALSLEESRPLAFSSGTCIGPMIFFFTVFLIVLLIKSLLLNIVLAWCRQ